MTKFIWGVDAEMEGIRQVEFKSANDWSDFCKFIKNENRFVVYDSWKEFLNNLKNTAKKRENDIKKGSILCRARIGYNEVFDVDTENGTPDLRMWAYRQNQIGAPPPDKSKNGRINPKGISYLYLSNDHTTAIKEVRPLIKETVSVGYFKTNKNIKCIDTSNDKQKCYIPAIHIEPTAEEKEKRIWRDINASFSKPVYPKDEYIEYLPTQYLSEYLKVIGYDGIIYQSSLSKKGHNVVLFNQKTVDYVSSTAFDIEDISFDLIERSDLVCK